MIKNRFSEVEIVTLDPGRVAAYRAVSRTPEEDAMKVLARWSEAAGLPVMPVNYGFDVEVMPEQAAAGLRGYEIWFRVPPKVTSSGPVEVRDFSGGRYAELIVFAAFDDPWEHIPAGWRQLSAWLDAHPELKPDDRQWLEEVVEREGERDLALYFPLK